MDPIGGINPSAPRLDNTNPQPQPVASPPAAAPTMPAEMPAMPLNTPPPNPAGSINLNESPIPAIEPLPDPAISEPTLPPAGGGKLKPILLGLLAVTLLAGLAAGAYFIGVANGKTQGRNQAAAEFQNQQAARQAEEDAESEEPAEDEDELVLGELKDPEYKDETIEGEVGKQVASSDGLVLKVTNIERNFKSTDPNYRLDASKELVKVNFLLGNVTKNKPKDITSFSFRLSDSTGAQLTPENVAAYEGKFDTVKIDPGSQTTGAIVYAVNKDDKPLTFSREQRYRITGENREVTTRISIVVSE